MNGENKYAREGNKYAKEQSLVGKTKKGVQTTLAQGHHLNGKGFGGKRRGLETEEMEEQKGKPGRSQKQLTKSPVKN